MSLLLMTKIKNMFEKKKGNLILEYHLKNININGAKKGCSGFIINKENEKVIYITTEEHSLSWMKPIMYREAKSIKDYTGGINMWANKDEIIEKVIAILEGEKNGHLQN